MSPENIFPEGSVAWERNSMGRFVHTEFNSETNIETRYSKDFSGKAEIRRDRHPNGTVRIYRRFDNSDRYNLAINDGGNVEYQRLIEIYSSEDDEIKGYMGFSTTSNMFLAHYENDHFNGLEVFFTDTSYELDIMSQLPTEKLNEIKDLTTDQLVLRIADFYKENGLKTFYDFDDSNAGTEAIEAKTVEKTKNIREQAALMSDDLRLALSNHISSAIDQSPANALSAEFAHHLLLFALEEASLLFSSVGDTEFRLDGEEVFRIALYSLIDKNEPTDDSFSIRINKNGDDYIFESFDNEINLLVREHMYLLKEINFGRNIFSLTSLNEDFFELNIRDMFGKKNEYKFTFPKSYNLEKIYNDNKDPESQDWSRILNELPLKLETTFKSTA